MNLKIVWYSKIFSLLWAAG